MRFIRNVVGKAAILFLVLNILFMWLPFDGWLDDLSFYNRVFPGRWRFPWSENPTAAYNISTNSLDALFLAHEVSGSPETTDEFRVFLFGDSSVWGFLLPKEETLSSAINELRLQTPDGRPVRAYNLGYPTISLTKDLVLINEALKYNPDLIVWLVTLEAFPKEKQIFTPLVQENQELVGSLIYSYDLDLNENDAGFVSETFIDRTIFGKRREFADLIRLQLYGVMWSGTGIDQDIPDAYTPLQEDYSEDYSFYDFSLPELDPDRLSFDVLRAGVELAGNIPVLIINEPIFISDGENSDIRYNFFYPKWAYDDYREIFADQARLKGWNYADFWDQIPPETFTNTAIHMDARGTAQLANLLGTEIIGMLEDDR